MAHYMVNIMSYIFCYVTVCFHTPPNVIIKHYESYHTNYIYYSQNIFKSIINFSSLNEFNTAIYSILSNSLFSTLFIWMLDPPFFSQNINAVRNNLYHKPDNKCDRVDPNIVKGNTLGERVCPTRFKPSIQNKTSWNLRLWLWLGWKDNKVIQFRKSRVIIVRHLMLLYKLFE